MKHAVKRGFTLVEILIVVIILGILAAIVIPQFTEASSEARVSNLMTNLQTIRSQLLLYKTQHKEAYPAADTGPDDAVQRCGRRHERDALLGLSVRAVSYVGSEQSDFRGQHGGDPAEWDHGLLGAKRRRWLVVQHRHGRVSCQPHGQPHHHGRLDEVE